MTGAAVATSVGRPGINIEGCRCRQPRTRPPWPTGRGEPDRAHVGPGCDLDSRRQDVDLRQVAGAARLWCAGRRARRRGSAVDPARGGVELRQRVAPQWPGAWHPGDQRQAAQSQQDHDGHDHPCGNGQPRPVVGSAEVARLLGPAARVPPSAGHGSIFAVVGSRACESAMAPVRRSVVAVGPGIDIEGGGRRQPHEVVTARDLDHAE